MKRASLCIFLTVAMSAPFGGCSDDDGGSDPICGNGVLEQGELCDGDCPTTCDDNDPCTTDTLTGSAGGCDAQCSNMAITTCANGDGCCPTGCDGSSDDDCNDPCAGVTACTDDDGCCPTGCDGNSDNDCGDPCDGVTACTDDDGCCPTGCDGNSDNDCIDPCTGVTDCLDDDGCCPTGCDNSNDNDCSGSCTSIADLRSAADGVVDLTLCPALVTYVHESAYAVQLSATGPAIYVYEDYGWTADVAVGDEITLHVTELSTYHGMKEIMAHDAPVIVSQGNAVTGLVQDLSAGTAPAEDLEAELVQVDSVTVTAINGLDLTVAYGTATDVTFRIPTATGVAYCVGATFDFLGLVTDFDGMRLQTFADTDITNFDSSACASLGRAPVAGDIVLNEVLADPPAATAGDANCDGVRNGVDDEFVEIVNATNDTLDLSGVTISDSVAVRHTFMAFSLPPGGVVVVFGGGTPGCTWASNVQALVSSNNLSLNNTGDTVLIELGAVTLASMTYPTPAGDADTSMTLSPDLDTSGGYVLHSTADTADNSPFSAGTRIDGSAFP